MVVPQTTKDVTLAGQTNLIEMASVTATNYGGGTKKEAALGRVKKERVTLFFLFRLLYQSFNTLPTTLPLLRRTLRGKVYNHVQF